MQLTLHHIYLQRFRRCKKLNESLKKEVIFYAIIVVILIAISVLNNIFWKIGKEDKNQENIVTNQEVHQLEVNNITYNVPFEEKWLD